MAYGTSWLGQISASFATTRSAWKATPPPPAQLFTRPQSGNGGMITGPIGFPGWDEYERKQEQQNGTDLARMKLALQSSWVYADIQAIANEASLSTLQVLERQHGKEEDKEIVNHDLEQRWEAPNPFMGKSYLTKFWIWNLLLSGKAYLFWVVPTGASAPTEVWPIPSHMITAKADPQHFITSYSFRVNPQDKPILIDRKYITYSRLVHPFDLRDGLSPLAAIFEAIEADLAMRRWNKSFFAKENAAPTGLILVPKDTLDSDLNRVRMEIMDFFGGASNRRVGVARTGDMDWKPFDRSQKDMEFLQGREFSRNEIDRAFGFPEGYWSANASRANAEGAVARMIENAVWPHLVMLSEDLNAQTIPQWYGDQYRAQFEDIRPRNRALEMQEFAAYSKVLTVNDLRAMIKKEPFAKDDPRGLMLLDELSKQSAIAGTEAAELIAEATPEEEPEPTPDPTTMPPAELPDDPEQADGGNATDADKLAPAPDALDVKALDGATLDLARYQAKAIKALKAGRSAAVAFTPEYLSTADVALLSEALNDAQSIPDVVAVFETKKKDALTPAEIDLRDKLIAAMGNAQPQAAQSVVNGTASPSTLGPLLTPALIAAYADRLLAVSADAGLPIDPAVASTTASAWGAQFVPGIIQGIDQTTTDAIARLIEVYRATPGMTLAQVAGLLAPTFGVTRADVIAVTEITRASSQATVAAQEYLRKNGLETTLIWRTNNDEVTCKVCSPRNGTKQGDGWNEPPPAHPRCRCNSTLSRS